MILRRTPCWIAASLALVLLLLGWTPVRAQDKELVAVLNIKPVGATEVEASGLTDRLQEELLKTGRVTLVDRSQLEAVLNEQALQQTGCTDQECAVQVGQVLGVRKIVAGKVTRFSNDLWQISAIIVDVETAQTLRVESVQHRGDFFGLLTTQVPLLAARLAAGGTSKSLAGALEVLTVPSGGTITLDGEQLEQRSDALLDAVPAGEHRVEVRRGELVGSATVTVKAGERTRIELSLKPQPATLSVRSNPPGAEVRLDGRLLGETPLEQDVPAGSYTLAVGSPGHHAVSEALMLRPGQERRVIAQLTPLSPEWMQYESARSTWNWKRWSAVAGALVLGLYGASEAQAASDSAANLNSLVAQANAAGTFAEQYALFGQIQSEQSAAESHASKSNASYLLAAGLAAVVWWVNANEPSRPNDPPSRLELSFGEGAESSGPSLRIAWTW